MKIGILVSSESTKNEFARVLLTCQDADRKSELDLEFTPLRLQCSRTQPVVLEFLFISSLVYAVDKLIPRSLAADNWTRELEVVFPVTEPERWQPLTAELGDCLSFLTGDVWNISFEKLGKTLPRLRRWSRLPWRYSQSAQGDAVSLFSGGLDSLIGAIDWLEQNPHGSLVLVGHHDGDVPGPRSDQNQLLDELKKQYLRRVRALQVRVGQHPGGDEITLRSRSLLFLALGIYAAQSIGPTVPLIVPENGTIALNVPLTPSRRGSCSTRTTHPHFLKMVRDILNRLGIQTPIVNPLEWKTKGECVRDCLNQDLLRRTCLKSVSCAKRGHKSTWVNRTAAGCGRCIPCIFRRAALHTIEMDVEPYGLDICSSDQIDIDSDGELASDLRACVSFLQRHPSRKEIAQLLLANGSLDVSRLPDYAGIIERAMEEVHTLLLEKGCDDIKQDVQTRI